MKDRSGLCNDSDAEVGSSTQDWYFDRSLFEGRSHDEISVVFISEEASSFACDISCTVIK